MFFLYTCGDMCNRVSVGITFKLDMPKGANIVKARFTFWTSKNKYAPIPYTVYIHTAMEPISYLKDCKYEKQDKFIQTYSEWDMQNDSGSSILNSDVEISTGNILQEIVQKFVNDESYKPDEEYFMLFFVNNNEDDESSTNKERIQFYGHNNAQKRPRLIVEWN